MRIYTFRCSRKADLLGVSQDPAGANLPDGICNGTWDPISEEEVEPGHAVPGFVSRDLFRDLDNRGFHLAVGRLPITQSSDEIRVGAAIAAANVITRFFRNS